jgi:hypothetical protein
LRVDHQDYTERLAAATAAAAVGVAQELGQAIDHDPAAHRGFWFRRSGAICRTPVGFMPQLNEGEGKKNSWAMRKV